MSDALDQLFATIAARKGADPSQSYTAKLLAAGVEKCARKFGEEATSRDDHSARQAEWPGSADVLTICWCCGRPAACRTMCQS